LSVDNQDTKRERFAGPFTIFGLVGAGLLLLVALYPEKSLLRLLSTPSVSSPAQQRYLEALVRLRQGDAALVLPLVRSYLEAGCTEKAERALNYQQRQLSGEQNRALMALWYELRLQQLEWMAASDPGWRRAQQQYAEQVEALYRAGATSRELVRYLVDARRLGDQLTAHRVEALLQAAAAQGGDSASAEILAERALAKGEYRRAAGFYFKGMQAARGDQRRELYLAGVRALQSGNLVQEALAAAEQHLYGELAEDRTVLKFLIRLSLAANRPDRAQKYAWRALGMDTPGQKP
jgi:polysaccharide biosynthesis protein PelB